MKKVIRSFVVLVMAVAVIFIPVAHSYAEDENNTAITICIGSTSTWNYSPNQYFTPAPSSFEVTSSDESIITASITDVSYITYFFLYSVSVSVELSAKKIGSATITIVGRDGYPLSETVTITVTDHTEIVAIPAIDPTCSDIGWTEGSMCNKCGTTIVAQEEIPALGHIWGEPTYSWESDHSIVTASRSCTRDQSHVDTEIANTTSTIIDATYESEGSITYTASFTNSAFETQTYTESIPMEIPDIGDTFEIANNNYEVLTTKTVSFNGIFKNENKVDIPDSVTLGQNNYEVVKISEDALSGIKEITIVSIGKNVKTIGTSAFDSCPNLKTVTGGSSVTTIMGFAFSNCKSLTAFPTLSKVKKIGIEAFKGCTSLSKFALSDSIATIEDSAFASCTKLKAITGGSSITNIKDSAFSGCKALKTFPTMKKVTAIGANAFKGCSALTKFTLGSKVKTIGKNAFASCTKLATVSGGAAVTSIGDSAFSGCKVLKTFPALSKLQAIGASAFKGCAKLTKFTLAKTVKSIGKNAFNGCKALKTITVKTEKLTNSNVGAAAFKGIHSKATFSCPKKKLKDYKTLFVKKGAPKTAKFK